MGFGRTPLGTTSYVLYVLILLGPALIFIQQNPSLTETSRAVLNPLNTYPEITQKLCHAEVVISDRGLATLCREFVLKHVKCYA